MQAQAPAQASAHASAQASARTSAASARRNVTRATAFLGRGAAVGSLAVGSVAVGSVAIGRRTIVGTVHLARKRPSRGQLAIAAAVCAVVLASAWLLVRNSSLVEVQEVRVVGLDGYYDRAARNAVATEARGMTTMNVDESRLQSAAGEFVDVADVTVDRDYPHGITVILDVRHPVAAAKIGDRVYAVTGAGLVLQNAKSLSTLPNITVDGVVSDGRVVDPKALQALRLLGVAPDVLLRRVKSLKWGRTGLTLVLDKGVRLIFGNAKDATEKWRAAAAVLAAPVAKGAKYIDLRVPGRPAIGGLGAAPVTIKQLNEESSLPSDPTGAGAGDGITGATGAATAPQTTTTPAAPNPTTQSPGTVPTSTP